MADFFLEFSAIIIVAAVLGIIFKKFRQPTVLAFLVTGILLGSAFFDVISFKEVMSIFSDLGIAFLLFLVGLNLDPRVLKDIGKTSIITGIGQIGFTFGIGYLVATGLGFVPLEAMYIGLALTFSSTIIIIKLLTDKNDLNSLYAKISIGFLLVQDAVAVIALIFVSAIQSGVGLSGHLTTFAFNIIALAIILWIVSKYLIKRLFDSLAKSQELLFLGGISWCFALAALSFVLVGSKEIGAFMAGVSIAALPYSHEVFGKLRYLRDFFIVLFFVYLGSSLVFTSTTAVLLPAIALSLVILVGNPIIIFTLLTLLGYKGRTSFMAGLSFAQISEFSLILLFLGEKVGHLSSKVTSTMTMVAVITIAISTYFILYNNKLYEKVFLKIPFFRKPQFLEEKLSRVEEKKYSLIIFGFGDSGKKILSQIKIPKSEVLVIDYDPGVIRACMVDGAHCMYGDASDLSTIGFVMKHKPKIVVSTVMDPDTNDILAKQFGKRKKDDVVLIILASSIQEAKHLREKKADFVLVPSQLAAEKVGVIINDIKKGKTFELKWIKQINSEEFI